MELLRNINQKGTTILMATHDYNLISKYPNTTYKCEEGKLSEIKKTTP
jgi:cell division transport system ATP-binding protein